MIPDPRDNETLECLESSDKEWASLSGGTLSKVWKRGNVVRRSRGPHSDAVVQVIEWLNQRAVSCVPRILAVSEQFVYREYVEGETVLRPWSDAVKSNKWVQQLGGWLAEYEKAIEGFRLTHNAAFARGPVEPASGMIVCHGDLGPWNFIQVDGQLTGVIDWDLAHFGPKLDNLAFMAIEAIPLREPTEGTMGAEVSRSRIQNRLDAFLDAHGGASPNELLAYAVDAFDRLIEDTRRLGADGVAPFDEFVARGFLTEYQADRDYIDRVWVRSG